MDWAAAAYRARRQIGARKRTFPEDRSLALIDVFAERGTMTAAELRQHGPADVVATILGHVTTAVHGKGHVPTRNGWYRRDETGTAYVIDAGFAVAWKGARACEGPPIAGAHR
ncbi:hypothetical protein VQ03_28185 [Methylobacterium tarhaniae]|uniref:Uncharacterized protein n=1 Tax=Methylobacterium tarhaniae TaxID=1187852 RepID=A0A0J6SBM4_9HYPH|nr:hypothetical protein [Methylobacterium tarhaniae]KMO30748.1 hypothetical protein VQ03_28185 [Methylobacterium tarhaniae]